MQKYWKENKSEFKNKYLIWLFVFDYHFQKILAVNPMIPYI